MAGDALQVPADAERSPLPAVAVSLGLALLIVLADVVLDGTKTQFVGLLVAVPFLAASFLRPPWVLAVGAITWLGGLYVGLITPDGRSGAQYVRLGCIAAGIAGAVLASQVRCRHAARLVAVQSAADAASRAILRPLPPVLEGVPLAVRYVSASDGARVGGDLYEAVATDHGLRMVVGDVRGKGLDAVRLASLTLGSFREAAHREADLQQVAAAMHAAVLRDAGPEDFVTALLVQLDGDAMTWVSCGHPAPLQVRDGAAVDVVLPPHPPLGLAPPPAAVRAPAVAGDRFLLYTDGAAEARHDGVFFPLVPAAAAALSAPDLQGAVDTLSDQVHAHAADGGGDDVAFLAFEVPHRVAVPVPRPVTPHPVAP